MVAFLASVAASAQGRIDRVIDDLEKKNDVETTYTERRTAKSHKLYRTTMIINFKKDEYYKRLAKAFEDERDKSVSAIKTRDQRTYKFIDDKGTSTYTLTNNSVIKSWRGVEDSSDDDSSTEVNWDFGPVGKTLVSYTDNNGGCTKVKTMEYVIISGDGTETVISRKAADVQRRINEAMRLATDEDVIKEAVQLANDEALRYSSISERM